jgi:hypothetical protein
MTLPPAIKALVGLVVDDSLAMGRRIEAAESLMTAADVPDQVVGPIRRFLLEVAENPASMPGHRIAAAKVVLKRDHPSSSASASSPPNSTSSSSGARTSLSSR